jgi:hypothetical protein
MSTPILSCRAIPALSLAAGLFGSTATHLSAEKALQALAATTESKPAGYDLKIEEGQLIRAGTKVDATLANVVDALRDRYTEANIIFSPGLAKLKVGDLKLRAGWLGEELQAVRVASGEKFEVETPGGPAPQQIDPTTSLPLAAARSINAGLFVLRQSVPPAQRHRVVEAFNIGPYLDWLRLQPKDGNSKGKEDDYGPQELKMIIMDTIGGFTNDGDTADRPVFQYHPGASLLIVIGNTDAVEIARKIVNALPGMSSTGEAAKESAQDSDAVRR